MGDRYRPLKLLGRGGFGRTFLAVDEHIPSKPWCVIKQLFPQQQGAYPTQKAAELFYQEAMRLDELVHPQIPKLLAHFTYEQHQYLIQTYVDGHTLAQELAQTGTFDESQIRQVLQNLLPVLQFIHDRQIIHRDIKPENIVRRRSDNQLVLVDFGASKVATLSNLGQTGTVIGSAGYAAPEQVGGKATFASDLYGLGVTCVHLLTSLPPFDLYSFSEGRWIWRDCVAYPVSEALGKMLDRMLEPAVNRRYAAAATVLQDLQPQAIVVPPALPPVRARTPAAAAQWQCRQTLCAHTHSVATIAVSPSGKRFASGSYDKTVKIWDLGTGAVVSTLKGHSESVSSVAFSPEGTRLISGSVDDTIRVWCPHTESLFYSLSDHADSVLSLSIAVSPDGLAIASSSEDRTVKIWNLKTGKLFRTLYEAPTVTSVAISPDGEILVAGSGDNTMRIWDFYTGELLHTLKGHLRDVNSVAIGSDRRILASGSSDNTVKLWDLQSHKVCTLSGHLNWVKTVAFSPDGQLVASGSSDTTIRIWSVTSGKLLHKLVGHTKDVNAVAFSPDGKFLISGSSDRTIKIWQQG